MDTSKAEQVAGFNVSYENSFTAIKRDILKETVEKNQNKVKNNLVIDPIEENPVSSSRGRVVKNSANTSKISNGNKSKDHSIVSDYQSRPNPTPGYKINTSNPLNINKAKVSA